MDFQVLRVHHYGETEADDRRMTLSPGKIVAVAANPEEVVVRGRTLLNVSVLFDDGGAVDLTVNHADLELIEKASGTFGL